MGKEFADQESSGWKILGESGSREDNIVHKVFSFFIFGALRSTGEASVGREKGGPKQSTKYMKNAGAFASLNPKPPTIAGRRRKHSPPTHGQPELRRFQALRRAAADTHHQRRDEANAENTSAGDTPQAPVTLEPEPPAMAKAAAG